MAYQVDTHGVSSYIVFQPSSLISSGSFSFHTPSAPLSSGSGVLFAVRAHKPGCFFVPRTKSGSGEPAAPRRQSLLRSQARCALLPAATPREGRFAPSVTPIRPMLPAHVAPGDPCVPFADPGQAALADLTGAGPQSRQGVSGGAKRPSRGVAAGRSAQRACERSSDWRRGAAGSPDPDLSMLRPRGVHSTAFRVFGPVAQSARAQS